MIVVRESTVYEYRCPKVNETVEVKEFVRKGRTTVGKPFTERIRLCSKQGCRFEYEAGACLTAGLEIVK